MERLLFMKVELWVVGLLCVIALIGSFIFGWLVYYDQNGGKQFGALRTAAVAVVRAPGQARAILSGNASLDDHWINADLDAPSGFTFYGEVENPQYVLVSRYDGDIRWSVVELYREGETVPVHRWVFDDPEKLSFESDNSFMVVPTPGNSFTVRMTHPVLTRDGRLFLKNGHGAMYEFDACAEPVWKNWDFAYHHSIEMDADGNLWVAATKSTEIEGQGWDERLKDDHILKMSTDGGVLYTKSVLEILLQAGMLNLIYDYDNYVDDPIHLNDVQPVLEDGSVVRRGDVFLSLGHLNMVLLFRPEEDRVIWFSQNRIMHQHDVDLIGPDTISVYDNRRKTDYRGKGIVLGANELVRYELPATRAQPYLVDELAEMNVSTYNQGLHDDIPGSGLMVEETSRARLVKFGENDEPQWVYMNRSESGDLWIMNWSRYIPASIGAGAAEKLMSSTCGDKEAP